MSPHAKVTRLRKICRNGDGGTSVSRSEEQSRTSGTASLQKSSTHALNRVSFLLTHASVKTTLEGQRPRLTGAKLTDPSP